MDHTYVRPAPGIYIHPSLIASYRKSPRTASLVTDMQSAAGALIRRYLAHAGRNVSDFLFVNVIVVPIQGDDHPEVRVAPAFKDVFTDAEADVLQDEIEPLFTAVAGAAQARQDDFPSVLAGPTEALDIPGLAITTGAFEVVAAAALCEPESFEPDRLAGVVDEWAFGGFKQVGCRRIGHPGDQEATYRGTRH